MLAAAAVLLTAVGWAYYAHHRASLRADAERLLLSTGQIKLDQLVNWRKERFSDALLLAESRVFSSYAQRLVSGQDGREAAAMARERLRTFIKYKRYPFAAVADVKGGVLVYAGEKPAVKCPRFNPLALAALAAGRPQMGDLYLSDEDASPYIDMVAPVGGGSRLLLLLRVAPADYLYPLLQSWSAKRNTGEILLVTRDGDDVLFLTDLRHVRDAAMRLRRPANDPDLPAAVALRGYRGIMAGEDYRGVKVLAAVNPVEGTSWALVTKMDRREVMAGSAEVGVLLVLLLFSLLAGAGTGAFLLFKRQGEAYERSYAEMSANYRLLNEKANDCILVIDISARKVLEANPRACQTYGYAPDGMRGLDVAAVIPERDRQAIAERIRANVLAGSRIYEAEHRRRNGEIFPVEVSASLVDAPGGSQMFVIVRDIGDRKRAERKLADLARQRQLALDAADLGWWRYVPSSKMAYYDERYKEIFEVAGSSQPNDDILKRLHPDDLPGVWARVEAALDPEKREPYSAEYRILMPDGRVKWVEAHGLATFDPSGPQASALELVGTVADVSPRRQAEDALRESERSLKDAQRLARIGNWTLELPSNRLSWSDEIYRIFEIDPARFGASYKAFLSAVHPDDREFVNKSYTDSLRNKTKYNIVHRLLMKDGRVKYVNEFCETFYNPDGSPQRSVGTVQDITERKTAEEALAASEAKFRTLFETMEEGFSTHEIICDDAGTPVDYRFLDVNPAFERITGLKREDLVGRTVLEALPGTENYWIETYGKVALTGQALHVENFSAELGKWFEVSAFSPGHGKFAVSFFDITARRKAELETLRLNSELAAKNREMENFLYITTHDLRSPLVNIQGFSQNMGRYLNELRGEISVLPAPAEVKAAIEKLAGEKMPGALEFVLGASRKMDALIAALLKVSRAGRVEMRPEAVDVAALLGKVAGAMRFQMEQAGAELKTGALPPCLADPGALSQVFSNLLDNAVKYRREGHSPVIEVHGEIRAGRARYRVADNGPGIPEADLDRIWNVFYRQDRAGAGAGEGIGLPMVKRLVEKNGGTIAVESEPGKGTAFTIELPAAGEER